MKEKKITLFLVFILLFTIACSDRKNNDAEEKSVEIKNSDPSSDKKESPKDKKQEITIIGVGDIMLGSNYPSKGLLPNDNILKDTEAVLKEADLTVGNLEGTLFDSGGTPKSCSNPSVCYVFRTPSSYGQYLKEAGFDYLSVANNHSNDFGSIGIDQTIKNLDSLGIKHSGIKDVNEWAILEKDGIKYGFVSFAPNMMTVKLNDYEYAKNLIKSTKEKVDILIVMFHGGAEGSKYERIPRRNEIFYGENRGNVFEFARMAVDSGADIIFGQGPHVTRAIELYNGKFISYSAGNFATYGNFSLNGPNGIAPIFRVTLDNKGNFISGKIIPTRQYKGKKGPFIDSSNAVIKKIISLNGSDFPEGNGLNVSENGDITKK